MILIILFAAVKVTIIKIIIMITIMIIIMIIIMHNIISTSDIATSGSTCHCSQPALVQEPAFGSCLWPTHQSYHHGIRSHRP